MKPTNSGIVLYFSLPHPSSTKISMGRNQFKKALLVSSDKDREKMSLSKMRGVLSIGYPKHVLTRTQERRPRKKCVDIDGFLTYVAEKLSV